MDLLTITFDQACREISRRTFVTELEDIGERMSLMGKMAKIVGVYRAARAKETRREAEGQQFLVPNIWELHKQGDSVADCPPFDRLCEEIATWLEGKFPLMEDYTYAQWTDDVEGSTVMYVGNPGIDLCWDEAAELFECPQNLTRNYGLMILPIYVVFFSQFVSEDQEMPSLWELAAEWFGWGVEMPWWLWLPNNIWATDNKKFYRLLEKAGLSNAADTFRMAWHDTGTFFLDLEHQHDSYYGEDDSVYEFTVANIKKLTRLWDEARPIYDRGFQACHETCENPEMYKTIVDLLGRCIVPSEKKMTVKELKTAAAENKRRTAGCPKGDEEEDNATE